MRRSLVNKHVTPILSFPAISDSSPCPAACRCRALSSWFCLAAHRPPLGTDCHYPAPGQHAVKAAATVAVAAAAAAAATVAAAAAETMTAAATTAAAW